jgi:L-ascorbate metabolism protein UlaG (beta-lactamase superfamily)
VSIQDYTRLLRFVTSGRVKKGGAMLTFYGHAGFGIDDGNHSILIDPWFKGNPVVTDIPTGLKPDLILATHGHYDHLGESAEISKQSGATLVSTPEVCDICEKQGAKVERIHYGGTLTFPFAAVTAVPAWHSSSVRIDGERVYSGNPLGLVITWGDKAFYHAGDTCLFGDMALIADRFMLDYAILPIGGRTTMGPEDAVKAVQLLRPRFVIPMHYDTWERQRQDAEAFKREVERRTPSRCVIMKPGSVHHD